MCAPFKISSEPPAMKYSSTAKSDQNLILFKEISVELVGIINKTNSITITILDIIHRPIFYLKLNSTGLSVPNRKHITSPLRAQQVNVIYRFVTTVY
jgi:hypothetical protein